MDTTIVGRHVKRGADERRADEVIEAVEAQYQPPRYIGLHQATFDSRIKRLGRTLLRVLLGAES